MSDTMKTDNGNRICLMFSTSLAQHKDEGDSLDTLSGLVMTMFAKGY
jgi:hypothetical protein